MPWNEPGGNGKNNDPWNSKKDQGPPALDKIFNDLLKKCRLFFQGKKNGSQWQPSNNQSIGVLFGMVGVVIVAAWFLSGLFIVNPAEEAVILRFGKYSDVLEPGLHWFARFIDTKQLVDVRKVFSFSLQGDFLTKSSDQNDLPNPYVDMAQPKKSSDGSADQSKNLVNVELNVQYRIQDARAYLFNLVEPDDTIKAVAAGALSDMVGQMKLDEVLTTGRENLSMGVMQRIKVVMAPYQGGLEVMAVTLRKVQAPDQVRAAFSDVNRADQDKATYIQQAQAYASKVLPLAQGVAARILADATGYQQQALLGAEANIAKFQALLKVYLVAPDITRQRMYFETMQHVLQNSSKVLVDVNSSNNLIYLPVDKLLQKGFRKDISAKPSTELSNNTSQPIGGEVVNDTN